MAKLKTRKFISDRVRVTKTGKVVKTTGGQGHFNAREAGKVRRSKRVDSTYAKVEHKTIKQSIQK